MRTKVENHCTDSAHFSAQFPAMFSQNGRGIAGSSKEKGRKYGLFAERHFPGSRLDLGRFTKVIPAFFLKSLHRLKVGACSLLKTALHGFCTLFPNSASLTSESGNNATGEAAHAPR